MQKLDLPDLMRPDGGGYMPLYCAAQWIASQGGAVEFDPGDEGLWRRAFDTLLAQLASEEVRAIGKRQNEPEPVPGHHFATCRVSYPFHDTPVELITSNETYLRSFAYEGEKRWRDGFDDALVNHRGSRWSQLVVRKEDVARAWPFGRAVIARTGGPGRPSCMQYVLEEFERRIANRDLELSGINRQAEALRQWVKREHPLEKHPTAKTIANNIRHFYWEAKNA